MIKWSMSLMPACRALGVVGSLLLKERKAHYVSQIQRQYIQPRQLFAARVNDQRRVTIEATKDNRQKIDWNPFFYTWELAGPLTKNIDR